MCVEGRKGGSEEGRQEGREGGMQEWTSEGSYLVCPPYDFWQRSLSSLSDLSCKSGVIAGERVAAQRPCCDDRLVCARDLCFHPRLCVFLSFHCQPCLSSHPLPTSPHAHRGTPAPSVLPCHSRLGMWMGRRLVHRGQRSSGTPLCPLASPRWR